MTGRSILHVHIIDDDGKLLADVDAASTADGLAYFLRSRKIDPNATEASVRETSGAVGDLDRIVREERHPITRVVESTLAAFVAEEEGR